MKRFLCRILAPIIAKISGVDNNKIFCLNFNGLGFGDNPKYISTRIHEMSPSTKIVWGVGPETDMPSWITKTKMYSFLFYYHIYTSKVIICNTRPNIFLKKCKDQKYIQTWHGGIALKKIEKDAENALSEHWKKLAKHDSNITDLYISNSRFCTEMYRRAFWYDGEILECGSPRCDYMINYPKGDGRVKKYFNVKEDVMLVLYAPTFRKDHGNPYDIDLNNLMENLVKKFSNPVKVIVRLHPNIRNSNFFEFNENVLNGTLYPDMYELLAECDILITDYSSTMFEMGLINKPVFLYASDISNYESDRGFYFNLNELPFPIAKDSNELENLVKEFNYNEYCKKLGMFMSNLGSFEKGNASESVANYILDIIKE